MPVSSSTPMPIARDIPGYYFCPVKKKYFKIEKSQTAPVDSFYNAANVKKRRLEQEQAAKTRKRRDATKDHIKRALVLSDPMTGGRLMREVGLYDPELLNKCWLAGLQDKGQVAVGVQAGPSIDCMLVNGDDTNSGMAVAYAAIHGAHQIRSCYVSTDRDDFINFNADPLNRRSRQYRVYTEPFLFNEITSIACHSGSHRILLTSREPGQNRARIAMFKPLLSLNSTTAHDFTNEPEPRPAWLLGESQSLMSFILPMSNVHIKTTRVQPAAHGASAMSALVATNRGLLRIADSEYGFLGPTNLNLDHADVPADCLSADWHPTNPNVIYAGDRNGKFFRHDTRGPSTGDGSDCYRHRSSVAHVRAIDDFQILAAGPNSAMAIYDVRRLVSGCHKEAAPVCVMHQYINKAHIDIGLDVTRLHGGEGVVAAASSSGTVQVFSMRTGDKLRAGALDRLSHRGLVFKCLQWETMPGDKDPSLWVSVGSSVKKYSFGLDEGEDVFP